MNKKVSVVIPFYNVEKYIGDCLKSVIAQSLKDIEIICVNDKSPDNSAEIVKQYQKQDERIILVENEQNGGLSYARNEGSKVATGKYIYYLDSDDTIQPNALQELYDLAERDNLDVIFFDSVMFFENATLASTMEADDLFCAKEKYENVITGREFLTLCYEQSDIREPVWIQFHKRAFLEENKIDFYEGILHEDVLFTYKVLMAAKRLRCINERYHNYRIRENAITTVQCSERHIVGLMLTYCEIMAHWNQDGNDAQVKKAVSHYLDRISWKVNRSCEKFPNNDTIIAALEAFPAAQKMFNLILEKKEYQPPKNYGDWGNVDWPYLCSFEKIVIYGAGVIGKEALRQIGEGHGVSAFAVTEKPENLYYLMGLPVYQIDKLPEEYREGAIAIAAKRDYQKEMKETAEKLGYKNIVVIPLRE